MGVILDSCVWVGMLAGRVDRQSVIDRTGEALVFTSVMTLGELAFGV